jgi:hypothetical protein
LRSSVVKERAGADVSRPAAAGRDPACNSLQLA